MSDDDDQVEDTFQRFTVLSRIRSFFRLPICIIVLILPPLLTLLILLSFPVFTLSIQTILSLFLLSSNALHFWIPIVSLSFLLSRIVLSILFPFSRHTSTFSILAYLAFSSAVTFLIFYQNPIINHLLYSILVFSWMAFLGEM